MDINLDWDAPATNNGAAPTGYKIERSESETTGFAVLVADTGNTDTDYTDNDTNLVAGTTYYYKVSAINTYGTSPASNTANAAAADVPAQVTGLAITAGVNTESIYLGWTTPSAQGSAVTGYHIQKSTDGINFTDLTTNTGSTSTTQLVAGLTSNTLYYYKVSAYNAFGEGVESAVANGPPLPTPPSALILATLTDTSIKLDWFDPSGPAETGFKIEISTDGTVSGPGTWTVEVADTGTTSLTYTDTGLTANTLYFYRISTINQSGESAAGTWVGTSTWGPTSKPLNLVATSLIGAEIKLDWDVPLDNNGDAPSGYKIERSTDGTNYAVLVADTGSTAITYTDGVSNTLTTGTTYYYQISAINTYGTSTPSTAANAIASDVPAQVTNLTATAVVGKVIDIAWTAPNNGGSAITGYKIERSTDGTNYTDLVADTQDAAVAYSDINLIAGTTYYYKVSAINIVGTGTASTVASVLAGDKPDQITVITATAVIGSEIDLAWTAPTDNSYAISSYAIEFSLDGSTNWQSAGSSATNSFTHSSLTDGTTYYYRVSSTNSLGTSTFSGVVNALAGDAPDQVTGLITTVLDDTQIRLNWTTPDANSYTISGYKIEQSPDGSTNWADVVSDTQSTTIVYTVTGLQPQTEYYYRVSAINSLGAGPVSTAIAGTTFDVPDAIADLSGSASGNDIVLTWSAPTDNGAAISKYIFQVQSVSSGNWITLDSNVQALTATHTGISSAIPNTQISYRVYAVNVIGQSPASNVEQVWTLPTPVTGLTVTPTSGTEIEVSWTTITGLTYKLEHSADGTTWGTEADPATTPYTDSGLAEGSTHYYRAYAVNPSGTSAVSSAVSATTFDNPTQPLNLILTPTITDLLEVTLTWSPPSDDGGTAITNYVIHRSVDSGFLTFVILQAQGGTETTRSYVDGTLTIGTTYYYRVQAENSVDVSNWSATVSYVSPTLPDAPTGLTATPYGTQNTQIKLTWVAPANSGSHPVIGYMIERSDNGAAPQTLTSNTNSASTTEINSSLSAGTNYQYKVYAITAAGTGNQASTSSTVMLVDYQVSIVANVIGGNTIEIIPTIESPQGTPSPTVRLINLYMDGNFVDSLSPNSIVTSTTQFQQMYAYPTSEADFYVIAVLTQDPGGSHQASETSQTVSATPSDPFTGELDWNEFRVLQGSSVPSEQDYTQSNLELDIQPVGSDIIVKYTPQDPLLNPVILGFNNVQQALDEVVDTNPSSDYYVGVYIDPQFSQLYTTDPVTHVVSIDCNAFSNDYQALGLTCQEDDIPLGYKSDIAFRSLKDPTSPTQLGIEGMGDLFGMPMVMLFIIGIAAVFTGRSAQMGGIIIVALISVMIYLGYLPLMWESTTWVILIIIVILGIFIGKRWS